MNILNIFTLILTLALMAVPCFILTKFKFVKISSLSSLANLLLLVSYPILILNCFVLIDVKLTEEIIKNILKMVILSFITYVIICILAIIFFFKMQDRHMANLFRCGMIFTNCGFIGIPLIKNLCNDPLSAMYATIYLGFFNIFFFSVGVFFLSGDVKQVKPIRFATTPAMIAFFIGILVFFIPQINIFKANDKIKMYLKYFGDMNTPIAMSIIGIRLADINLKKMLQNFDMYLLSAIKLIIVPIVIFFVLLFFKLIGFYNITIAKTLLVAWALPPGANVVAMCEKYDRKANEATSMFCLSTIISIIILPFILMLANFL